jgi:hypothetical protein
MLFSSRIQRRLVPATADDHGNVCDMNASASVEVFYRRQEPADRSSPFWKIVNLGCHSD